jgi:hypothetical protein
VLFGLWWPIRTIELPSRRGAARNGLKQSIGFFGLQVKFGGFRACRRGSLVELMPAPVEREKEA